MGDEVKVTTEHLNARADIQREAAGIFSAADAVTDGATLAVGRTHGLACAVAIAALNAAQSSRTAATQAMNKLSNDLADKLVQGAADYRRTDQQGGSNLDGQMHPR
ncbi:type VII secretion target [Mycolicibacterium sp. HK-90]|uniref:type VII secretion target n=1 Tax=Mycolicibacterium sp. HK-90 TaxID=3056937 RepID=UPI0026586CB0|nr:type VII secretion target [Mycolicibacterium sp. HK-90]WKG04389.1 type VII secretion target [Mycolicibacterium sp. HK-90]